MESRKEMVMHGAQAASLEQMKAEEAKLAKAAAGGAPKPERNTFREDVDLDKSGDFSELRTPEDRDRAIEKYLAEAALPAEISASPQAKEAMGRYVDMAVAAVQKGLKAGKDLITLNTAVEERMRKTVYPMLKRELGIEETKNVQ